MPAGTLTWLTFIAAGIYVAVCLGRRPVAYLPPSAGFCGARAAIFVSALFTS